MCRPNSMKMTAREAFFDAQAAKARKDGNVTIQLRPKGATIDETIAAMERRGLQPYTWSYHNMTVFVVDALMDRVQESIEKMTPQGGLYVVRETEVPFALAEYRKWASLNGLSHQTVGGMLCIECKGEDKAAA